MAVGKIDGWHWTAVWTPRGSNVRLISVLRARPQEMERYEGD